MAGSGSSTRWPTGGWSSGPAQRHGASRATPRPGDKVLIWYDPADPDDVLVYGHWGRTSDRVFLSIGLLLIVVGTVIAVAGH